MQENEKTTNGIARRVLETEASALRILAKNLPHDFEKVIEAILVCKGKVIVSGVGKSGHIGRKISATLASTGTPSYFVHATEASHGDLGLIAVDDFCILISNSGETTELRDIIAHTRRFKIPMAAISSKQGSTLVNQSDYSLCLPEAPEACAIGMAPTTSTTLTLALGDAIAIALMEKRDFRVENFKVFHPGGKLGAQMVVVEQLMRSHNEMAIVSRTEKMKSVVLKMTETGYGVAVVVDKAKIISGVITDGDLRRNSENLFDLEAQDISSKSPITIEKETLIQSAIKVMQENKTYSLIVAKNGRPIGLLRMHDLLRAGLA